MVISMDRWKGKVAIVTGASAGIGTEITKKLLEESVHVVGFARRLEKMQQYFNNLKHLPGQFYSCKVDMTQEEDILNAFKWTIDNVGPVSILVNNAGVLVDSPLMSGSTDLWKKVMDTNVMGLCIATREAIKIMTENDISGHIVHINSIGGHQISDFPINIYHASKYAVTALAETLRKELSKAKSNIKISSLSPGGTMTEMVPDFKPEEFNLDEYPLLKAEEVADAAIFILSTPPKVLIKELMIKNVQEVF